MTDRELLELAAKAAGIELDWDVPPGSPPWRMSGTKGTDDYGPANAWDPLTDDGDALRLAVKLDMDINIESAFGHTRVNDIYEDHGSDAIAATRRAIVRASAAIGEKL